MWRSEWHAELQACFLARGWDLQGSCPPFATPRTRYGSSKTHYYGKLVPENVGNDTATAEGEGALSAGADDKRSK